MLEIRECPPFNTKNVDGRLPWKVVSEIRVRQPSNMKMSTVAPLGSDVGDLGAPTIQLKTSTSAPLGGDARDPGTPTIQHENVDTRGPRRQCREVQEHPPFNAKYVDNEPLGPQGDIQTLAHHR
jgi:hypothetical protein